MRKKYYALPLPAVLLLAGCSGEGLGDTGALSGIELHITDEGSPEVLLQDGGVESDEEASLVINQGDGDDIDPGQILQVSTASVDPGTGAVQEENFSEDFPSLLYLPLIEDQSEFIYDSLTETDAQVGSEIALYEPASEGDTEDPMGQPAPESLIVLRIDEQFPAHAQGEAQEQSGDLPEVTGDQDEAPQLTSPEEDAEAPEETEAEVLVQGDGEEVQAEDQVVVQYTGWRWSDGTVFDSSWAGVEPDSDEDDEDDAEDANGAGGADDADDEDAAEEDEASEEEAEEISMPYAEALSSLVDGWAAGLEGQQVGSRVLLVVPPEEGYGDAEGHELEEETLIFAVDIIAASPMPEPQEQEMPEQPELSEEEIEELLEEMEQGEGGSEDDEDAQDEDETADDEETD